MTTGSASASTPRSASSRPSSPLTTIQSSEARLPEKGYNGADPSVIGNRLVNVGPRPSSADGRGNPAWNAHEWDVK